MVPFARVTLAIPSHWVRRWCSAPSSVSCCCEVAALRLRVQGVKHHWGKLPPLADYYLIAGQPDCNCNPPKNLAMSQLIWSLVSSSHWDWSTLRVYMCEIESNCPLGVFAYMDMFPLKCSVSWIDLSEPWPRKGHIADWGPKSPTLNISLCFRAFWTNNCPMLLVIDQ